ncbi:MAG: site-specific integrase [Pseudomonadota bacterium]
MAKQTGLVRGASGIYAFQMRVPVDLLPHYAPKQLIKQSLRTRDLKEAKRLCAQKNAELHAEWDALRATKEPRKTSISTPEIQHLVEMAIHSRLSADESIRSDGVDDDLWERMQEWTKEAEESGKSAISRGMLDDHASAVIEDWLTCNGYDLPQDSPDRRRFSTALMKAQARATAAIRERDKGKPIDTPPPPSTTPPAPPKAPTGDSSLTLSGTIQHFLARHDKAKSMYRKYDVGTRLLLLMLGDKPVHELQQVELERYCQDICRLPAYWSKVSAKTGKHPRDLMLEQPTKLCIAPGTFENTYKATVSAYLSSSKRSFGGQGFPGYLSVEKEAYKGSRGETERKQRAFTAAELKRLFEGEELQNARQNTQTEAYFWLPLVGLLTGARVNEVCQINPQTDVLRNEEGIWYFSITGEGNADPRVTKSIKNKVSRRDVPLHATLLELDFLSYFERVRSEGAQLLFPTFKPKNRRAAGSAEEWFRDLLRETGLRDETPGKTLTGFHAFRHTIETRAKNLRVGSINDITGHAGPESAVVRGYQGTLELAHKQQLLDSITFELDLSPIP